MLINDKGKHFWNLLLMPKENSHLAAFAVPFYQNFYKLAPVDPVPLAAPFVPEAFFKVE